MTFDFAKFLTENLISGYQNGSFTKEQVGLYAFNYFSRQQITQDDFDRIRETLDPPDEPTGYTEESEDTD